MRDDLHLYYEKELDFLRQMGVAFKAQYPLEAKRLALEANKCEDPHVERLIESFAFLAARVHMRLDDDYPEITEALLQVLYPHYLQPIPSMSIVQMEVDPDQVKPDAGLTIERGAVLDSPAVDGVRCKFRTSYDVTFWPVEVADASWKSVDASAFGLHAANATAAVVVTLRCFGDLTFSKLALRSLRFHLNGPGGFVHDLYEVLCNNSVVILARDAKNPSTPPVVLRSDALRPVGFAEREAMLPYSRRSFEAYRVLQEYFCFPGKFLFLDLNGFEEIRRAGFGNSVEIAFLLSPFAREDRGQILQLGVTKSTFRLGCTPIVNLFEYPAEPVLVDHAKYEQPIAADVNARGQIKIYSVDDVMTMNPRKQETVHFRPFYSYRHGEAAESGEAFWYASRRALGNRNPAGPDVYVVTVDLTGRPKSPNVDVLHVSTTRMNGDLPSRLYEGAEFHLQGAAPVKRAVLLMVPTRSMEPPVARESAWRLISLLSLNYLSLVEEGKDALQAILRLHNFTRTAESEGQINGIVSLRSRRSSARITERLVPSLSQGEIGQNGGRGQRQIAVDETLFARGTQVEITFDDQKYAGAGIYLFASVLEWFLGSYVTLNSFSQLVARTRDGGRVLKVWPPRSGHKILL